jgi:hypothetical protein
MHVIDDFILFVSSLNSTMLNIDNMVCKDQKKHVLEALEASFGFNSRLGTFRLLGLVFSCSWKENCLSTMI